MSEKPKSSPNVKPLIQTIAPSPVGDKTVMKTIRDFPIQGKAVFLRMDFNVPLNGSKIEDDTRIVEALPTIQYAIEKGAKVVLASHLGRPDGKRKPEFSLEPVATRLAELLKTDVTLADDCVGEGIELMVQGMKNGQVLLLENLRFHKEEEANDPEFASRLARLAQIYVNDAFGTAHRKHASTYGVATLLPARAAGFR
jgi:phosphoglycerate kinase